MDLDVSNHALPVYRALGSEIRLEIIRNIGSGITTASELSKKMSLSESAISKNLAQLLDAGLIVKKASDDDRQNKLELAVQDINIHLPRLLFPKYQRLTYSIPLGNYFAIQNVTASCGLADDSKVIGKFDDPNAFLLPDRFQAQLLWFTKGRIEYQIPNELPPNIQPKMLEISAEMSSEFPRSNNNWPSSIGCYINNQFLGAFTVPGNFSDVRGRLTPSWWDKDYSQYGVLKYIRITDQNTGVDGKQISDVNLSQLKISNQAPLRLAFETLPPSGSPHGLTIFGHQFGNYPQDIQVTVYYTESKNN